MLGAKAECRLCGSRSPGKLEVDRGLQAWVQVGGEFVGCEPLMVHWSGVQGGSSALVILVLLPSFCTHDSNFGIAAVNFLNFISSPPPQHKSPPYAKSACHSLQRKSRTTAPKTINRAHCPEHPQCCLSTSSSSFPTSSSASMGTLSLSISLMVYTVSRLPPLPSSVQSTVSFTKPPS